jgi:hypothetical protein
LIGSTNPNDSLTNHQIVQQVILKQQMDISQKNSAIPERPIVLADNLALRNGDLEKSAKKN